jgi:hypothetical protein
MRARSARGLILLHGLAACAGDQTWYEARGNRTGLSKGTAAFEQCVARDKAWIESTSRGAQ